MWIASTLVGTLVLCGALVVYAGYYEDLGIKKDADDATIRRVYRQLAKQYHPDKNPDTAEKFQQISEAYEVLSDSEKRKIYDQHGKEGLERHLSGGNPNGDFNPFESFFHGGMRTKQGKTVHLDLPVSLQDLYTGVSVEYEIAKQVLCPKCHGTGAKHAHDVKTCTSCGGRGVKVVKVQFAPGFEQHVQQPCDACGGKGKRATSKCPHCHGTKVVHGSEILNVVIEPGMDDNEEIIIARRGDQPSDIDAKPSDVIFTLRTEPHPYFTRRGHDLYTTILISLKDAIAGFTRVLTHLDGHEIIIKRRQITQAGFVLKLSGEGMPHRNFPSEKGNLFVEFEVFIPTGLTESARKAIAAQLPAND